MILFILRGVFILLSASVTMLYVLANMEQGHVDFAKVVAILVATLAITGAIVIADSLVRRKQLSALSGVFIGMLVGLLAAYALSFVVDLIGTLVEPAGVDTRQSFRNLMEGVKVIIGLTTCYLSTSFVIQTKDDFRFVIPYVEFTKQIRGNRPVILDTSVIIDGRILDIIATKLFQGTLVVPKFVLHELQTIADSPDKLRRARGRRGLDILQKLQEVHFIEVVISDTEAEGSNVDQKLVSLAQSMQARVMTNDFNLNKIATLRGLDVVNLNELAKALRPVVLPGEGMRVKIIKPGEAANQGVGYLEDGTMVVVEHARAVIGQEIDIIVTSTLQTSAGRMIFGRRAGGPEGDLPHDGPDVQHQGPGSHHGQRPGTGTGTGTHTPAGAAAAHRPGTDPGLRSQSRRTA